MRILICFVFSQVLSLERPLRLCVNCAHYRNPFWVCPVYGKCDRFPRQTYDTIPVTGRIDPMPEDYTRCYVARAIESLCGKQGKCFKSKQNI